jgi:hypothetical protein
MEGKMKILTTLAAASLALTTTQAIAEQARPAPRQIAESPRLCAAYASHASYLAKAWGEMPVFTGTVGTKFIMRLFANQSTGTWTMLLVHASGTSCVRATGKNGSPNPGL